jgi:hypothetical protein
MDTLKSERRDKVNLGHFRLSNSRKDTKRASFLPDSDLETLNVKFCDTSRPEEDSRFPNDTGVLIKLKEFLWLALALLHTMLPVT